MQYYIHTCPKGASEENIFSPIDTKDNGKKKSRFIKCPLGSSFENVLVEMQ